MMNTKGKMYIKLLIVYTLIIILMILILDVFFMVNFLENNSDNELYINDKVIYDVNEELTNTNNAFNIALTNMYRDNDIITDIIDYLKIGENQYLKNKLDKYSLTSNSFYKGIEYFTEECFSSNENLENIEFLSYDRNEINSFNRENKRKYKEVENAMSYVYPKNSEYIYYIREINNPITYKSEGQIVFIYNLEFIKGILNKYSDKYGVIILQEDGYCIYDSGEEYNGKNYPFYDKIIIGKNQSNLEKKYNINSIVNTSGLITIGKVKKTNRDLIPFSISMLLIDLIVFIIAELIFYRKVIKLSDRMDMLLIAMDHVKEGNIKIDIPIGNELDEISIISENFNDMCKQLNEYIEKSYLSELKEKRAEVNQKKAELMALQSQINPHFLYNTLESIRMKAICNGDREVGRMLYILAFLFRNQLKENDIIAIKSEIDYCQKYLEIFKFRYEEKFKFTINCPEEILGKQIIKFTLQPLIENYFVHGIKLENNDNKLSINIKEENNNIIIELEDNGKGIEGEKVKQLNEILRARGSGGKSIGITNANERIGILYGEEYGIRVVENVKVGTKIIVTIPMREGDSNV